MNYQGSITDAAGAPVSSVSLCAAGDNGFLLFVNGQYAGQTATIFNPYGSAVEDAGAIAAAFGDLKQASNYVDHSNWQTVYAFDLYPFLQEGDNDITFYAYNTADEPAVTGTAYNQDNNPGGLLFAFEFYYTYFN